MIFKMKKINEYKHGTSLLKDSERFLDKSKDVSNGISSTNDYSVGLPYNYYNLKYEGK